MALELWNREMHASGESALLVVRDHRREFAELLLVCGDDVAEGQLVGPDDPQADRPAEDDEAEEKSAGQTPPPSIPILPRRGKRKRRFIIFLRIDELDASLHAFNAGEFARAALSHLEDTDGDWVSVSLKPDMLSAWGYIEPISITGQGRLAHQ
jgi:hypothetical protein